MNAKRIDRLLALLFFIAIAALVALMAANRTCFDWAFARHQNQFSWYIRPLFLIPFRYFAYRRSLAGIAGTLFLLLTSMFFFPKPTSVSTEVQTFLEMEQHYLTGGWSTAKILMTYLVPISLGGAEVRDVPDALVRNGFVHADSAAEFSALVGGQNPGFCGETRDGAFLAPSVRENAEPYAERPDAHIGKHLALLYGGIGQEA